MDTGGSEAFTPWVHPMIISPAAKATASILLIARSVGWCRPGDARVGYPDRISRFSRTRLLRLHTQALCGQVQKNASGVHRKDSDKKAAWRAYLRFFINDC
jgi:hypothetical protein